VLQIRNPHHVDADPDPTFHPNSEPDPDPSFQIKAEILYIWACNLQIDADPDTDPVYHFGADPDFYLMRMLIRVPKMTRIHADSEPQHW
jgi:hypothetical protein